MKKIKVTINGVGKPIVHAEGFTGSSCEDATLPIEMALSNNPLDNCKERNEDWYRENNNDSLLYE